MYAFRLIGLPSAVVGAILAMGPVSAALAAKIETGSISVQTSNLGNLLPSDVTAASTVTTTDNSNRRGESTNVSFEASSVVQTPPTESSAGLRYFYKTPITTTSWLEDTWRFDNLSVRVSSQGQNQDGGKWISIGGSVTSELDFSIAFSFEALGKFTPTSTPFGSAVPLLASFYFGPDQGQLVPVPGSGTFADLTTLSYSTNTYNSTVQSTTFSLTAGAPQTFIAYVYAGAGVSIEQFNLFAKTGIYDFTTTPGELISRGEPVLVGAETIAPIPGAEPVVMLAAGLAVAAAVAGRRRKRSVLLRSVHG